ncbi:HAD-IA family hydrolase [Mucilaginibacter terrae]|uniref:Hydrolase of the HAD superfamily n=1 Tax=Mucilaginibacter terrae TaxID=1955052 RepID=A0ABU3H001_9SPHI|nr:HAD-IA family hydrolase [Mucilaginibacter terrae]MDT3405346.1 putative hydrolase of the HAD superfamily [Mucilaginibacter terrae]
MEQPIKVLLLDIGGVLLTDGWETSSREKAAVHFNIDAVELNQRHRNVFDAYESGRMTLDDYLRLVVFYEERSFTPDEFKAFMMDQSQPLQQTIDFMLDFKAKYKLPIVAVNNEPKELNEHRINKCGLKTIIDFFVSSCYVHMRKPDPRMYHLALNLAQVKPHEALYLDDRKVYTELASGLGIKAIQHTSLSNTIQQLKTYGF